MMTDKEALLRKLPTARLVRMAERANRNSQLMRERADRLWTLAHELAVERGEHTGQDGLGGPYDMRGAFGPPKHTY